MIMSSEQANGSSIAETSKSNLFVANRSALYKDPGRNLRSMSVPSFHCSSRWLALPRPIRYFILLPVLLIGTLLAVCISWLWIDGSLGMQFSGADARDSQEIRSGSEPGSFHLPWNYRDSE